VSIALQSWHERTADESGCTCHENASSHVRHPSDDTATVEPCAAPASILKCVHAMC
jgi:hypothetical protein